MRSACCILAIAGYFVVSGSAIAGEKGDLKRLQGKWKIVKTKVGGKDFQKLKDAMILVKGDTFTLLVGDKEKDPTKVMLDESKKPSHINFLDPESGKTTGKGIYLFKGNQVTFCWEGGGLKQEGKRPAKFESTAGSRIRLLVLERVEAK